MYMNTIKKSLILALSFSTYNCFSGTKTINIEANTNINQINQELNSLADNDIVQLSITNDPYLQKTVYTLYTIVSKNKNVKLELTAKDSALTDKNLKYLTKCLLRCSLLIKEHPNSKISLTKLIISNNNLSADYDFIDYLSTCSELTEIDISLNNSNFCSQLLNKLVTQKLTKLAAQKCNLKARCFENLLKLNPAILELNLSQNNIDELTKDFIDYLKQATSITTLNLKGNAQLFTDPNTTELLLEGIEGKSATITLTDTNYNEFIQLWINELKGSNTIIY